MRAAPSEQDKGGGAAAAALHLIALSRRWSGQRKGMGFKPVDEFRVAGTSEA